MKKSVICATCETQFSPELNWIIFQDCAFEVSECPKCHHKLLLDTASHRTIFMNKKYSDISIRMKRLAKIISDKKLSSSKRIESVNQLKTILNTLADDNQLNELTKIYLYTQPTNKFLGYNIEAVQHFINAFKVKYEIYNKVEEINLNSFLWLKEHGSLYSLDLTFFNQFQNRKVNLNEANQQLILLAQILQEKKNPLGEEVNNLMKDENFDDMPFGKEVTYRETMETAQRMFEKYSSRKKEAINLFQVTDDIMPKETTTEETAAFRFFKKHSNKNLILPASTELELFKDERKKFEILLAQNSKMRLTVVSDSKLAYYLFLSQVALDIDLEKALPVLNNIHILDVAPSKNNAEVNTDYIKEVSRWSKILYLEEKEKYEVKGNPINRIEITNFLPSSHSYEEGTLEKPVYFELPPLSISETHEILTLFAPKYEKNQSVKFEEDALLDIATTSRPILDSMPDPEKAIFLLDEISAEYSLGENAKKPTIITKQMAQKSLADRYNSFPPSVLDRSIVKGLEETLNSKVIGQSDAVNAVAKAMKRASVGFNNPNRPIATFLFAGPTGVGKTELAKQLTIALYGRETEYVRLDMTEYGDHQESVHKLIGLQGSYRNSEQGGVLTNALKEHPNAVILFDEFEKSHPNVQNLMLQMLDDGRLTSGLGEEFSLTSNILIFTSNAGMERSDRGIGFGGNDNDRYVFSEEKFSKTFAPELQNRFSHKVVFNPLSHEHIKKIFDIKLSKYENLLQEQGISLSISEDAKNHLIDLGYDPDMGARPLERTIDDELMSSIAELIMDDENVQHIDATLTENQVLSVKKRENEEDDIKTFNTSSILYVDGAFNPNTNTYGYGIVLVRKDAIETFTGFGDDSSKARMRNFAGEMDGVIAGLKKAIKENIKEITVSYSYDGIKKWATGDWAAKKPESKQYQDEITDLKKEIDFTFKKADSSDFLHQQEANELAKQAVGLIS